jgi:hypothetical protein
MEDASSDTARASAIAPIVASVPIASACSPPIASRTVIVSLMLAVTTATKECWRSCGHRWGERLPCVNGERLCIKLRQLIQPFENQWHAPVIQHKSRNRIEKTRFAQKASCCFGEIHAKIGWRIGNLFEYRASSIDHGDEVFQIVACQKIHLSTSPEGFHLGTQEIGSCDQLIG